MKLKYIQFWYWISRNCFPVLKDGLEAVLQRLIEGTDGFGPMISFEFQICFWLLVWDGLSVY